MIIINAIHVKHEFLLKSIVKKPVGTLYETLYLRYVDHLLNTM
jgi:hypothetical protein